MILALSEEAQQALAFGIAAGVALAVWVVVLVVMALATRPRAADPVPATQELGGSEPPAVVSFLENRWEVGPEAVPATLIDLAARKVVAIEQIAPERFVVRLRGAPAAGGEGPALTPYEDQVLDHVRRLAVDGVVPCEALTTGPEEESKGWRKRFEKQVVADARSRGLSRSRWNVWALAVLWGLAVVPAFLGAVALVSAPDQSSGTAPEEEQEEESPVGGVVGLTAVGAFTLMMLPLSLRAERDTKAGREAASRWLGLREYLADDEMFDSAPPAAVAIWDRYLSYGAAMGVAAGAVRGLPLGTESDKVAWSPYGGRWHLVRVKYPRLPPGWGKHPLKAAAQAVFILGMAGWVAYLIGPDLFHAIKDFLEESKGQDWRAAALIGLGVFGGLLAVLSLFLLRWAVILALAVSDFGKPAAVEGLVIRMRGGYVAVDDGASKRIRAWRVQPGKLAGLARGVVVRVNVSRRLGHVFSCERVGVASDPHQDQGQADAAAAAATRSALANLDLDGIARRTGIRLSVPAGGAPSFPGADQTWMLSDESGHGGVLVVVSADHGGGPGPSVASGVLRMAARRATKLEGVGDEASWAARRNLLMARRGDRNVVVVVTGLRDRSAGQRLDVAKALAVNALRGGPTTPAD